MAASQNCIIIDHRIQKIMKKVEEGIVLPLKLEYSKWKDNKYFYWNKLNMIFCFNFNLLVDLLIIFFSITDKTYSNLVLLVTSLFKLGFYEFGVNWNSYNRLSYIGYGCRLQQVYILSILVIDTLIDIPYVSTVKEYSLIKFFDIEGMFEKIFLLILLQIVFDIINSSSVREAYSSYLEKRQIRVKEL